MRAQLATNLRVVACRWGNNACYYTIDYVVLHSRVFMDAVRIVAAERRADHFREADLSILIYQACLSRHLSEMLDRIAKRPEDVKKSVADADELP